MKTKSLFQHSSVWIIFIILTGAYLHFQTYAFQDDYDQIIMAVWNPVSWLDSFMTVEGRPLYALFILSAWQLLQTPENAIWLRVFGLLGVNLTAFILYAFSLKHLKLSPPKSALIATFLLLTPAVAVYTFWACTAVFAFSAAIGTLSGWLSYEACLDKKNRFLKAISASLLLLISELIYQPTASFFLLPIALIITLRPSPQNLRKSIIILAHFASLILFYFVAYKLLTSIYFEGHGRLNRVSDVTSFQKNFLHYLKTTLPFISSGWGAFFYAKWATVMKTITLFGVLSWAGFCCKRQGFKSGILAFTLLFAIIIAAGAHLIGSGTYASFRTLSAPSAIIVFISAVGLYRFIPKIKWLELSLSVAVVLATAGLGRYVVTRLVVTPLADEYQKVTTYLNDMESIPVSLTCVLLEPIQQNLHLRKMYTYGTYNSVDWSYRAQLTALIAQRFNLQPTPRLVDIYSELITFDPIFLDQNPKPYYMGTLIDFNEIMTQHLDLQFHPLSEAKPKHTTTPYFGQADLYPNDWIKHPQMGWFKTGPSDWINHQIVGWLLYHPEKDKNGFKYFESIRFGMLRSDLSKWPLAYSLDQSKEVDLYELAFPQWLREEYPIFDIPVLTNEYTTAVSNQ